MHVRYHQRKHALGQRELCLVRVLVRVVVALLVVLKHGFVDTMVLDHPGQQVCSVREQRWEFSKLTVRPMNQT